MKILVTGGAGFIGSHVVDAYIEAGHQVVVVDDLSTGNIENLNRRATLYQTDICDLHALEDVFAKERFDVVCHQAARMSVQESLRKPVLYAQVNIVGSLNLLELSRRFGIKKFIYASTGGAVYGEPQYLPVDENHPINPLDPYGASKHTVEHYLYLYHANFGIRYTVLRYANVYGPRQNPEGEGGVVAIFTHRLLEEKQPVINGSGEQERDFVYVGDLARANVLALEAGDNTIFNLGTGTGTSINRIFASLSAGTSFRGEAVYGPAKQGEVFKIWLSVAKAKDGLGWSPTTSLDSGLEKTIAFFKAKKNHSHQS